MERNELTANTHDYTRRTWGHNYVFYPLDPAGLKAEMLGWGKGIQPGDYIILQNETGSTRYQFKCITYYQNPSDMWEGVVTFAPRKESNS